MRLLILISILLLACNKQQKYNENELAKASYDLGYSVGAKTVLKMIANDTYSFEALRTKQFMDSVNFAIFIDTLNKHNEKNKY